MKKETPKFYWHLHHGILCESLTEPLKNRIEYIKKHKPQNEIKLRLKLLKPVRGKLPKELIKVEQEWVKAKQRCSGVVEKLWRLESAVTGQGGVEVEQKRVDTEQKYLQRIRKCIKAFQEYDRVWQKYPKLEALHRKECPNCPWNGETIFGG